MAHSYLPLRDLSVVVRYDQCLLQTRHLLNPSWFLFQYPLNIWEITRAGCIKQHKPPNPSKKMRDTPHRKE
jgi:hypothetical protein